MPAKKKRQHRKRNVATEATEDDVEEEEEAEVEEVEDGALEEAVGADSQGPTALIAPGDYVNYMTKKKKKPQGKNKKVKPAKAIDEAELPTILVGPADYENYMTKAFGKQKRTMAAHRTVVNEAELPTILMSHATPADYINYTPGFPKPEAKKENFIPDDAPTALLENLHERENRRPTAAKKTKKQQESPNRTPLHAIWTATATTPSALNITTSSQKHAFSSQEQASPQEVFDKVNEVIRSKNLGQTFAVIHLYSRQYLLHIGDIFSIPKAIPADVGEKIKLEKCLLVGNGDFTLIGRPVLNRDLVQVEAVVVEKTMTQTYFNMKAIPRDRNNRRYNFTREPLSMLRVTDITVCHELNSTQKRIN
ncbi:39S ribosomal protein L21, mitochondrial [Tyrophagus putrescentiae]|nr:39S ribosomal protein L21, mitochondrial [Tyrophagus putrescentiae]